MTGLVPVTRRALIARLRELGFEGHTQAASMNSW
jgi:hypothetical protein